MQSTANRRPTFPRFANRSITQTGFLLVGFFALLCGAFVAVQTVRLAVLIQTHLLLADEWRVLPRFIEFTSGKLSLLAFLWEDHFGHRPALARILFALDIDWLGGTQVLPKTVSICLCVLSVALFAFMLMQQKTISLGVRLIGAGLLALVFLPNQQIHNFSIGWNSAIQTAIWFSVFALYCLAKSIEKTENANWTVALFFSALFSGILATCSMANGLLIWPIMFLMCVRFRVWPRAVIVALVAAAMTAIYLWDFQRSGLLFDSLKHPGALLHYLIAFLEIRDGAWFANVNFVWRAWYILPAIILFAKVGAPIATRQPFGFPRCLFVCHGTAGLTALAVSFGAEEGNQSSDVSPWSR